MAFDENLNKWRHDGKHLPKFMRDFHDQKNLFKTMHHVTECDGYVPMLQGMSYVIDLFLWFMARHGYTLQKSGAKQNFEDLPTNIAAYKKEELECIKKIFSGHKP